jgi:hypothetical protein
MLRRKTMNTRLHRGLSLTALTLLALLLPGLGAAEATTFDIEMSGAAPDGSASGTLTLDSETGEITWEFEYSGIATPTAMHIHQGAAGASGGVVVPLSVEGEDGKLTGSTSADPETVQTILASPADYYVNIHNADHPPGAVRGQLAD